ncbi:aldo/keto reductase [Amnibacterium flavum]|uniref:Aldo/keto reductase n=1 Tax=Amnibacterium flavum TaxID=2173173 RepID=A0A2V1HYB3_9MICO|nr:aldo/keto reductase [Amnibacterium flavum]PVZ95757.1 aldo/keto reductase [Amnibacterium flavum]
MTTPTLPMIDGTSIPTIGLGTYSLDGEDGAAAVAAALRTGYRLIDTALGYGNEDAVGAGIRESGIPRDEIVLTTKLPGDDHGYEATLRSFETSRANLGLDTVDVYLIHWPEPEKDLFVDSWRAMIELQKSGSVRTIGVSNFSAEQILRLEAETGVLPALNQIELHIGLPQDDLRSFHESKGIVTESYSPLKGRAAIEADGTLQRIADEFGVSWNQVALRWSIQLGTVPIPRSKDAARQAQNFDVFGFELNDEQMRRINELYL